MTQEREIPEGRWKRLWRHRMTIEEAHSCCTGVLAEREAREAEERGETR